MLDELFRVLIAGLAPANDCYRVGFIDFRAGAAIEVTCLSANVILLIAAACYGRLYDEAIVAAAFAACFFSGATAAVIKAL